MAFKRDLERPAHWLKPQLIYHNEKRFFAREVYIGDMTSQNNQKWDSDDKACKIFHFIDVVQYILVYSSAKHIDTQNTKHNVDGERNQQALCDGKLAYFFSFDSQTVVGWEKIHLKGISG